MNIFEKMFVNSHLHMESCSSIKYVSPDHVSPKIVYDKYKILPSYLCSRSFCWNLLTVFHNLGVLALPGAEAIEPFPSRDIIQRNMSSCFHSFPNLRIISDCTEIFVQKSSSLVNQNLSFSHYKHHTTIKFLIGITPSGVISLIFEGFGGRVSDRQMIEKSLLCSAAVHTTKSPHAHPMMAISP